MKSDNKSKNLVHIGFEFGLLLKGIDGILEIIGGILLLFLNSDRLTKLTRFLTQHELSEDPKDKVANALISLSHSLSISTLNFGILYLMSHGIIKCIIILLLWRKKLWAYPLCILSLILFILYQLYRYNLDHSFGLILLTIFDVVMIILTYLEYQRMKSLI